MPQATRDELVEKLAISIRDIRENLVNKAIDTKEGIHGEGHSPWIQPPRDRRVHDFVRNQDSIKEVVLNKGEDWVNAEKDIYRKQGTGSILDVFPRSLEQNMKSFPKDKYDNLLYNVSNKITQTDRNIGTSLASKGKYLEKVFRVVDHLPYADVIVNEHGDRVHASVPKEVFRATAPFSKAKRFALPLLVLTGAANLLEKKENTSMEEGVNSVSKNASLEYNSDDILRQALIDKIASTAVRVELQSQLEKTAVLLEEKQKVFSTKLEEASVMLKKASNTIDNLQDKVSVLTDDNESLKIQILAKERSEKATKLAKDMLGKGMIKTSDLQKEIVRIADLNDDNYELLVETVASVPNKADNSAKGLDKLSYMLVEDSNYQETPSFEDAILSFRKRR